MESTADDSPGHAACAADKTPDESARTVHNVASLTSSTLGSPTVSDAVLQHRLSSILLSSSTNSSRIRPSVDSSPVEGRYSLREGSARRIAQVLGDGSHDSPIAVGADVSTPLRATDRSGASPDSILVQRPPRKPAESVNLSVKDFQEKLSRLIEAQPVSPLARSDGAQSGTNEQQEGVNPETRPFEASPDRGPSAVVVSQPPVRAVDCRTASPMTFSNPSPPRLRPWSTEVTPTPAPDISVSTLSPFHQRPGADQMHLFAPLPSAPGAAPPMPRAGLASICATPNANAVAGALSSHTPLLRDIAELQEAAGNGRHWIVAPSIVAREDAMGDTALVSPMHAMEEKLHRTSDDHGVVEEHVTWMQYALSKPVPQRPARRLKQSALALLLPVVAVPFCLCVLLLGLHFWALRSQIVQAGAAYDPMVGTMKMPNFAFMIAVLLCFVVAAVVLVGLAYVTVWRKHVLAFVRTMETAEVVARGYCHHQALSADEIWMLKREVTTKRPTSLFEWYEMMTMAAIVHANHPLEVLFAYTDLYRLEQMVKTARARLEKPAYEAIEFRCAPQPTDVLQSSISGPYRAAGGQVFFSPRSTQNRSTARGSTSMTGDTVFSPSVPRSEAPGHVHSPLQITALSAPASQPLALTESAGGTVYSNDAIQLPATSRREESPAPMPSTAAEPTTQRALQRQASGLLSSARVAIMSAGRSIGGGGPSEEDDWRQLPNLLHATSAMRSPSMVSRQSVSPSNYYDREVQADESITLGASHFFENTTSNLLFQAADSQQQVSFLVCRLFLPPVGQTADATTRKGLAEDLEELTSQFYRALFSAAASTGGVVCDYQLDSALLTFNAFTPLTQVQLMPRATEAAAQLTEDLHEIFQPRPDIKWGIVLHLGGAIVSAGGEGTATYISSPEITLAYSAVTLCRRLQVPAISFTYQDPNEYFHWTSVDSAERDDMRVYVYAMEPSRWITDPQTAAAEEAATSQRFIWLFQGAAEKVIKDESSVQSAQARRAVTIARSIVASVQQGHRSVLNQSYQRLFESWSVPEEDAVKKTVGDALRFMTQTAVHSPRTARPAARSRTLSMTAAALPRPPTARPRSVSMLSSSSMPRTTNTPLSHSNDYNTPTDGRELTGLARFPRTRSRSATLLAMDPSTAGPTASLFAPGMQSASFLPPVPLQADASGSDYRLFSPPNIVATVENRALTPFETHHSNIGHTSPLRTGSEGAPPLGLGTSSDDDDGGWIPVTQNSGNVTKPHTDTPLRSDSDGFGFATDTMGLISVPPLNLNNLTELLPTDTLGASTSVNAASSARFGGPRRPSSKTFLRRPSSTIFESSVRNTVEFRPVIVFPRRQGESDNNTSNGSAAVPVTDMPSSLSAFRPIAAILSSVHSLSNAASVTSGDAQTNSGDYTIVAGDKIGVGTGGRVVYKGMFSRTTRMVAIKQVPLPESSTVTEATQAEIDILVKLRHKYIVGYISSCIQDPYLYIVMEFVAGGPMQKILDTFGFLPVPALRRYVRHILDALSYIHSQGVVHRDISANNVLVTTDGTCKLTDFGGAMENIIALNDDRDSASVSDSMISRDSDDPIRRLAQQTAASVSDVIDPMSSSRSSTSERDENIFRTSAVRVKGNNNGEKQVFGTPLYMSPQACMGEVHAKNDIWSLGILFCQCASGQYPWDDSQLCDRQTFISKIADGTFLPQIPLYAMNADMVDFAKQCLQPDLSKRWDSKQLQAHSFIIGRDASVV